MKKFFFLLIATAIMGISVDAQNQVDVVMGVPSCTNTSNSSGDITSVIYEIPIEITGHSYTFYLGQISKLGFTADADHALAFVFQKSNRALVSDVTSGATYVLTSSDAVIEDNGYRLDDGVTKHFTLLIRLTNPSTPNTFFRVQLKQIRIFTESTLINGMNINLSPEENFRTNWMFINDGEVTGIHSPISDNPIRISKSTGGNVRIYVEKDAIIEIYSITGSRVIVKALKSHEEFFPNLTNGTYILQSFIDGQELRLKIVN